MDLLLSICLLSKSRFLSRQSEGDLYQNPTMKDVLVDYLENQTNINKKRLNTIPGKSVAATGIIIGTKYSEM